MNAFNFVDEAIKGAIQFVFGFLHSTIVLYTRPLTGAKHLYLRARAPDTEQISSPTYLALCILLATPILLYLLGWLDLPASSFFASLAKEVTTGRLEGLGPLVGGTIAGTIFLSAVLRVVAWAVGLRGRKRDRLIVAGEYQFGLLVLGLALFVFLMDMLLGTAFLNDAYAANPIGAAAGGFVASLLLQGLLIAVLFVPSGTAAVSLWCAATRNPYALGRARLWLRMAKTSLQVWKPGSREARAQAKKRNQANFRRFLGLGPRQRLTLRRRMAGVWMGMAAYAGMLLATLLAGGAVGGGAYATNWLLTRDEAADIGLLALECRLEGPRAIASAVAWNRSDEPRAGWTREPLLLHITAYGPDGASSGTASWTPAPANGARTDVLAPRQTVEISGPIALPAPIRASIERHRDFECRLASAPEVAAPA